MIVRAARPSESEALTSLAFAAKALWGYSRRQLNAWSTDLQISAESIAAEPTYVAEVRDRVLGVVQLNTSSAPWQIECLWVHPEGVGRGLGARLVREAVAYAGAHGQLQLQIDADPNAEGFYQHLGARRVGVVSAPIDGHPQRVRPQLMLATALPAGGPPLSSSLPSSEPQLATKSGTHSDGVRMTKPIMNLDEVEFDDVEENGYYTSKRGRISGHIGAQKLGYNLTVLPPGKAQCPFHSHRGEEEMFFILEGEGELRFGDRRYPIRKHDVIACPTGGHEVAHQIINSGSVPMRYLALSNVVELEACEYPDSNKVMVSAGRRGESGRLWKLFRSENTVEYYDRESLEPPKRDG